MITKTITSKQFVLNTLSDWLYYKDECLNAHPYEMQTLEPFLKWASDETILQYAIIKYNEQRPDVEIDFCNQISGIATALFSNDKELLEKANKEIEEKLVRHYRESFEKDLYEQEEEFWFKWKNDLDNARVDDLFEAHRYDHAA